MPGQSDNDDPRGTGHGATDEGDELDSKGSPRTSDTDEDLEQAPPKETPKTPWQERGYASESLFFQAHDSLRAHATKINQENAVLNSQVKIFQKLSEGEITAEEARVQIAEAQSKALVQAQAEMDAREGRIAELNEALTTAGNLFPEVDVQANFDMINVLAATAPPTAKTVLAKVLHAVGKLKETQKNQSPEEKKKIEEQQKDMKKKGHAPPPGSKGKSGGQTIKDAWELSDEEWEHAKAKVAGLAQ